MRAFIFNSGRGSRLGALTKEQPKALVSLENGETLLSRQLRLLFEAGVRDVVISTGYRGAQIVQAVEPFIAQGMEVRFVENPDYASTNAIVSLDRAAALLRGEALLMLHGDLVFDAAWLAKVLEAPQPDLAACDATPPLNEKDFKARVTDGCISAIGVDLFDESCVNLMPFYKLSARARALWLDAVQQTVADGETQCYAETAALPVLGAMQLRPLSYAGHLLAEVDTPEDLAAVRRHLQDDE
ncbi:MAG: NTP transferase domain-containing protein [Peptococcaceae bacterium]|nr:NTP transferase domain-containing protein [Peptococcaceae bacterium]